MVSVRRLGTIERVRSPKAQHARSDLLSTIHVLNPKQRDLQSHHFPLLIPKSREDPHSVQGNTQNRRKTGPPILSISNTRWNVQTCLLEVKLSLRFHFGEELIATNTGVFMKDRQSGQTVIQTFFSEQASGLESARKFCVVVWTPSELCFFLNLDYW